jgi:hypothetical protein
MLTNIQSLFADILQTPEQRAMQLRNEGLTRAELATRGLSGGGQLLAPLISAQAQSAPMIEDMIRRGVGGLFGQDTRTESESIQNMLSQADTATPEGQQALLTAMRNQGYGVQAAQYQQMMLEEQQQQQAAAAQSQQQEFENTLQSMNYQLDVAQFGETQATNLQARRLAEAEEARAAGTYESEIQKQQREQRESEALRASNVAIINSSPTIPAQMKANLSRAALSGLFDQNPEEIYKIAYGNDEIVTFGGVAYNASAARRGESDTWLAAPKAPTNLAETILSDLDPAKFTPESLTQALTLFNQATTPLEQNTALSVLQLQSSSDPSNSVKILSSDLAMDVTAYNSWVRGGKQGEPDFWIKAPTAAETGTDAFSAIIEDLPWGNYTPESISTWLAAQDTAVTSLEKADTIKLLQPARSTTSSAALTPAILAAEEAATTSSSQAGRMISLSSQFNNAMSSGSSARMGAFINRITGNSDEAAAARLEYTAIKNVFVLASLPQGSASDADVALAMSTTPDEFNDPAQIAAWLRGQAKMAAMAAEYNLFKADYLNEKQSPSGLSRAWETQRNASGFRESVESKYGFQFNPDANREAERQRATQGRN